jgi:hypothetical protein
MTSPNALMVNSGAACGGMKATHVYGASHNPQMPKARGVAQAPPVDAGRLSWPDAAYRPSSTREYAGRSRCGRAGKTHITFG